MPKAPKAKTSYTLPDLIRAPFALGFSSPKSREDSEIPFFSVGISTIHKPLIGQTCTKLVQNF